MTNFDLSMHVFAFLKQVGVENIVVCAGARNAPMVLALQEEKFKIFNFFEERSAAFFALGLIKSSRTPVAVLTTSGTAVAELLPACVEASQQGLPLILISADRPKVYRGTGAPQTIQQVGLFSDFVEAVYDLDVKSESFDFRWSVKKPIHFNVCYDEPLIDKASNKKFEVNHRAVAVESSHVNPEKMRIINPLIIVSQIEQDQVSTVVDFIIRTKAPVYAESLSHLKNISKIETYIINSSELLVKQLFKQRLCNSVIRIGGVPTLRFWRDLESEFKDTQVLNYVNVPLSGLSRESTMRDLATLEPGVAEFPFHQLMNVRQFDIKLQQDKENLFEKYPLSEQAFTFHLSTIVATDSIYLGNSLPIRNWDQFARCESDRIYANRGANGIDGQISTYLGWSESQSRSYCYIGDLTAMYDLASLGLSSQLNNNRRNIVIMNNYGGQIFNRVFKNNDFINSHKTQFAHWAQMWGWNYLEIKTTDDLAQIDSLQTERNIIELLPNSEQTQAFWTEWDELCQSI